MSVSADTLRKLADLRLAPDQMAGVLEILAGVAAAEEDRKRGQRERVRRHRDMKRDGNVTVTALQRDEAVTETPSPKKRKVSPCTPSKEKNNPIPGSSEADASSEPTARDDEQLAFDAWNETAHRCDLPVAEKLTADRRSKLKARLADAGGLEGWIQAMARLEASAFCTGRKTDFRADLDFVLQAKSFTRLIEGSYDNNRNQRGQHEQRNSPTQRRSREDDINAGISDVYASRRVPEPAFTGNQGPEHGWSRDRVPGREVTLERGEDGSFGAYPRNAAGAGYGRH